MKTKLMVTGFIAVAATLLLTGLSSFTPQDSSPQYVSINAIQTLAYAKIVIIYENNSTEEIKLEKPVKAEAVESNAVKIHETINMLSHKGYSLVSTTNTGFAAHYIFAKK